jgi:hypothetical protein
MPNQALSFVIRIAGALVISGAAGCTSGLATSPSSTAPVRSVAEVNRDRDALVGERLTVIGRIHAQPRPGDEQSRVSDPFSATLQLIDPGSPPGQYASLDVYRMTGAGAFEPFLCQVSGGVTRCGSYTPDAVTTIAGTWRKEELPSGQIVNPDGRVVVVTRRTAYFLLVD